MRTDGHTLAVGFAGHPIGGIADAHGAGLLRRGNQRTSIRFTNNRRADSVAEVTANATPRSANLGGLALTVVPTKNAVAEDAVVARFSAIWIAAGTMVITLARASHPLLLNAAALGLLVDVRLLSQRTNK